MPQGISGSWGTKQELLGPELLLQKHRPMWVCWSSGQAQRLFIQPNGTIRTDQKLFAGHVHVILVTRTLVSLFWSCRRVLFHVAAAFEASGACINHESWVKHYPLNILLFLPYRIPHAITKDAIFHQT